MFPHVSHNALLHLRATSTSLLHVPLRTYTFEQPDDLNNIRKDTRKTVKAHRRLVASLPADDLLSEDSQQPMPRRFSEGDADDVEMCIRGLEHLTCKSTLLSLVKEKSPVVQAVLSLHRNRQPPPMELAEVVDRPATTEARLKSILLAMRYSALTRVASERAQRAAGDDEAEAYD